MTYQNSLLLLFVASFSQHNVNAFVLPHSVSKQSSTAMFGAFNKRNKQADLMKKMQEAKKQKEMGEGGGDTVASDTAAKKTKKTDEEVKRENDQKRFEQLLNSESATINYNIDGGSNNYMTKKQEEEDMDAGCEFLFHQSQIILQK
jgi:hypothetical protein